MEYRIAMEDFRSTFERTRPEGPSVRVLDAGCGSETHVVLPPNAYVVGIDLSLEALEQNNSLDERIVADLESVELPSKSFDLIVCWDVLEHLRRPQRALDTFASALAEEGILVIGAPNVHSLKGMVTKFTPYSFHRWIYRKAGTTSHTPHRTFLRLAISPREVQRWAGRAGLTLDYIQMYEAPIQARLRQALRLSGYRWATVAIVVRMLSLGVLAADDTDFVMILSKCGRLLSRAAPGPAPTRS